jgi:hypothetical protein
LGIKDALTHGPIIPAGFSILIFFTWETQPPSASPVLWSSQGGVWVLSPYQKNC